MTPKKVAPLTDAEITALRQLAKADERRQWALSSIKAICLYIAAIGTAWVMIRAAMAEFLK